MTPLAAIHDGKAVAVIAIPTVKTAIVVGADGRPRAVLLRALEVLPGYFAGSIRSVLDDAQSTIAGRRSRARERKLGRTP